jgi:TetR/AcrR family transcriptional regulator
MGIASRREREREERRNAIVNAAQKIFLAKGVAGTTMDEIAAAAEVSKGTLYLYFKSKEELYIASSLQTLSRLVERYAAVAEQPGTGLEVLRALGTAYVDFARDNVDQFRLGMSWLVTGVVIDTDTPNYQVYRGLVQQLFRTASGVIERGRQDGSIRPDVDAPMLAMQLWGGTVGVLLVGLSREEVARRLERPFDFDKLVPSFIDLLIQSIKR